MPYQSYMKRNKTKEEDIVINQETFFIDHLCKPWLQTQKKYSVSVPVWAIKEDNIKTKQWGVYRLPSCREDKTNLPSSNQTLDPPLVTKKNTRLPFLSCFYFLLFLAESSSLKPTDNYQETFSSSLSLDFRS